MTYAGRGEEWERRLARVAARLASPLAEVRRLP